MRSQLLLGMLFMLAVSVSFVLAIAVLYTGITGAYTNGTNSIGAYQARSSNALAQSVSPYSEFRIITTND